MEDIEIKEYKDINLSDLLDLYGSVGWINYTKNPEMLQKAYENSLKILAAWKGSLLVGIIRIIGDGYSIIYIQDILVRKEYQNQGIGSRLLSDVLAHYKDVYQVALLTDNHLDTVAFYRKMGFRQSDDYECTAFVIYN